MCRPINWRLTRTDLEFDVARLGSTVLDYLELEAYMEELGMKNPKLRAEEISHVENATRIFHEKAERIRRGHYKR